MFTASSAPYSTQKVGLISAQSIAIVEIVMNKRERMQQFDADGTVTQTLLIEPTQLADE
nr:hypothetical protein [Natrialba taiwanensis]